MSAPTAGDSPPKEMDKVTDNENQPNTGYRQPKSNNEGVDDDSNRGGFGGKRGFNDRNNMSNNRRPGVDDARNWRSRQPQNQQQQYQPPSSSGDDRFYSQNRNMNYGGGGSGYGRGGGGGGGYQRNTDQSSGGFPRNSNARGASSGKPGQPNATFNRNVWSMNEGGGGGNYGSGGNNMGNFGSNFSTRALRGGDNSNNSAFAQSGWGGGGGGGDGNNRFKPIKEDGSWATRDGLRPGVERVRLIFATSFLNSSHLGTRNLQVDKRQKHRNQF